MPGRRTAVLFVFLVVGLGVRAVSADDSPKAAETRKKLSNKIDVDYNETTLTDVIDDIKEKVPALGFKVDTEGGVSRNLKITYKAKQKTLAEVLDGMFQKNGCGYIVISQPGTAYDGNIKIKQGKERGYLAGEEAAKTDTKAAKVDTKKAAAPPKTKDVTGDSSTDTPDQQASRKLRLAKEILKDGKKARAKERLQEIVDKFPDTKAADEARQLIKDMNP